MARFYLHVINGTRRAPDEEGVELADAEAGRVDLDGRVEIADENGAIVRTVPFEEALEIRRAAGRSGGE
jgi:hypothetical protein